MSAYLKKGIAVWILGFLTLLAFLNVFNAALNWTLYGSEFEFEPYLIDQFTGIIQVKPYFWISVITAFVFLGCTAVIAFRKPPPDPTLVEMLDNMNSQLMANKTALEEGLEANTKFIEAIKTDIMERIGTQHKANEKLFQSLGTGLENMGEEMLRTLKKQEKSLQKVGQELSSTVEISIGGVKKELLEALAKQEQVIRNVGNSSRKSMKTIEKATADLGEMKTRLETLETALALPQPKMTSHVSPLDVKGIGPRLAEELKAMGITNVGEFLTADPAVIDNKTRLTRETAESLQGAVQLLMVPGIDNTDVELLKEVGVANRKELAEQDPFELSRRLAEVAKTYVEEGKISQAEKPTVEEVLTWVKLAKL
jgi:predicted flap endonuclease-1-like 5' DNA nuclease